MGDLKVLYDKAEGISLLYVEDNKPLRANATKLLKKIFDMVYVAADGEEGLDLFKKYKPSLVVTDIKMPKRSGLSMAKEIKNIAPKTKIIIMSAFDDKDILHKSIDVGVYKFLTKPVNIAELTKVLSLAVQEIQDDEKRELFQAQFGTIFNYQSSLIVMFKHHKPIIANDPFLSFFGVTDIDEFNSKYSDIGDLFLEQEGFLYNSSDNKWINVVEADRHKVFHIKMKDANGEVHHFLMKCQNVPEKKGYMIFSFDDVTDLNLLSLFDKKTDVKIDEIEENQQALFDLLYVIKRNNAKIFLHNSYKGVNITNEATIVEIENSSLALKMNYLQQKAIQYEKKTLIESEALPYPVYCEGVASINFDTHIVVFNTIKFMPNSASRRESIRVVPEDRHQVTLFLGKTKYIGDVFIADISLNAVKLNLNLLPAGLEKDKEVTLDIVFTMDKKPLNIHTKATVYTKRELKSNFEVVCILQSEPKQKEELRKYIAKRQMALIREFKGLEHER